MTIVTTDENGISYPVCPRCGGGWGKGGDTGYDDPMFNCSSANCMTVINHGFLLWLDHYVLIWRKDETAIRDENQPDKFNWARIPILPYDITLDKLKTYLLFS